MAGFVLQTGKPARESGYYQLRLCSISRPYNMKFRVIQVELRYNRGIISAMNAACPTQPHLSLLRFVAGVLLLSVCTPGFAHIGAHKEVQLLTGALEKDPGNTELLLRRSDLQRIHRDWAGSRADLEQVQRLDTRLAEIDLGFGRLYLDQGDPAQAIVHLNRYLGRKPDSVKALVIRAQAWHALDRPLAAVRDYNRIIALFKPPSKPLPEYYLERALALAAAGPAHLASAVSGLDAGIARLGNIQSLTLYAIQLDSMRGHHQAALRRIDDILVNARRRESWLARKADILISVDRLAEASIACEQAMDAIRTLPPHRRYTQQVKQLRKDLSDKLELIRDAG